MFEESNESKEAALSVRGFVCLLCLAGRTKKFVLAGLQCGREKTSRLRLPGMTTPRRRPSGETENSRKLRP